MGKQTAFAALSTVDWTDSGEVEPLDCWKARNVVAEAADHAVI